jgi:hypothetical protein
MMILLVLAYSAFNLKVVLLLVLGACYYYHCYYGVRKSNGKFLRLVQPAELSPASDIYRYCL